MNNDSTVFVVGGETMIGRGVVRAAGRAGLPVIAPSAVELPLADAAGVDDYFRTMRPRRVIIAAGRSGGIGLNQRIPADLMLDNLLVLTNVCSAAARYGVDRLLYLASSCCYPRDCPQPMAVEHLGAGPLEPTSAPYATAKLAGIQLCAAFRRQHGLRFMAAIPADVFGPDSSFDPDASHVIPALIVKLHAAKMRREHEVTLWGTGTPRREFLFADDLADACILVLERYDGEAAINLGGGTEKTIREVAELVADVIGYKGQLTFDPARPDGMPRKFLDSSVLDRLGWRALTPLREGLARTYRGFLERHAASAAGDHDGAAVHP